MKTAKFFHRLTAVILATGLLAGACACGRDSQPEKKSPRTALSSATVDLLKDRKRLYSGNSIEPDSRFYAQYGQFAVSLFRQTAYSEADRRGNYMISPLSVLPALVMTANGADGNTLSQMRDLLGGTPDMDEWNAQLGTFLQHLPSSEKAKLSMGNSLWLRDKAITPSDAFLDTNVRYFNADIFSSDFSRDTVDDVNFWVSRHTDGMIDKMLDELSDDTVMILLNALAFDAEWQEIYTEEEVQDGIFHGTSGDSTVPLMYGEEQTFLSDPLATGFVKPYADGYRFVAMLPNEGISPEEYIASPQFDNLRALLTSAQPQTVDTVLPKFTSAYEAELSDTLQAMGMTDAFDANRADFSLMGKTATGNPLFVSRVLHKTFISVDERGTKAGAATAVCMDTGMAINRPIVRLDRPFVYMIVDNEHNLPLFMGVVNQI